MNDFKEILKENKKRDLALAVNLLDVDLRNKKRTRRMIQILVVLREVAEVIGTILVEVTLIQKVKVVTQSLQLEASLLDIQVLRVEVHQVKSSGGR